MYVETECASEKLVNQRLAYVAVSRGQYDARIYTDDRVKLPRVLDRDGSHPSALDLTPPARRALDRLLSPAILRTPGASCKSGTALALPCKYGPPSGCSRDSRARVRPRQLHAPRRGGSGHSGRKLARETTIESAQLCTKRDTNPISFVRSVTRKASKPYSRTDARSRP